MSHSTNQSIICKMERSLEKVETPKSQPKLTAGDGENRGIAKRHMIPLEELQRSTSSSETIW